MNILKKADEIINHRSEEKERQYGPFMECNEKAAVIASIMTGKKLTALDVSWVQAAVKMARESNAHKEDNLLDLAATVGAINNEHNALANDYDNIGKVSPNASAEPLELLDLDRLINQQ